MYEKKNMYKKKLCMKKKNCVKKFFSKIKIKFFFNL